MTRYCVNITSNRKREEALRIVRAAPPFSRVEVKAQKRTTAQNALLWSLLTAVSLQKDHCGRRYSPDQWKVIFMHACGREVQFIPSLDMSTFIPWGQRSSDLSKDEMTSLIEYMMAWGAENGVKFHDDE